MSDSRYYLLMALVFGIMSNTESLEIFGLLYRLIGLIYFIMFFLELYIEIREGAV